VNKKQKMVKKKVEEEVGKEEEEEVGKEESWNALSERGASHLIGEYHKKIGGDMKKMRNHIKKVIALAMLLLLVGSVIVAGAKAPDSQRDWKRMCERTNGLIWGAVCELLNRVIALEEAVDAEMVLRQSADMALVAEDDALSLEITTLDDAVDAEMLSLEITTLDDAVDAEMVLRQSADMALVAEDVALSLEITTLDDAVDAEMVLRQSADTALADEDVALSLEISELEARVQDLEDQLDELTLG
jgi:hypothetical protein